MTTIAGYILTAVGILACSYGAGDILTMALAGRPRMKSLRRDNWLMGVGALLAALGVIVVLNARPGTLALV